MGETSQQRQYKYFEWFLCILTNLSKQILWGAFLMNQNLNAILYRSQPLELLYRKTSQNLFRRVHVQINSLNWECTCICRSCGIRTALEGMKSDCVYQVKVYYPSYSNLPLLILYVNVSLKILISCCHTIYVIASTHTLKIPLLQFELYFQPVGATSLQE